MSPLAPNLFDRRFRDFLEIGQARLRSLAPDWTDHNAHDPGITLMELLGWTAEAQLYSLSRLRRDERVAYAAMFGLAPSGTHGATGLIWSDTQDERSPLRQFPRSVVLLDDAIIHTEGLLTPSFRPERKLLWIPGRLEKVQTRSRGGRIVNHTIVNATGGSAFLPFGERGGRNDILALTFVCNDEAGPLGRNRQDADGALWAIGFRAAPAAGPLYKESPDAGTTQRSLLTAMFVTADARTPVPIVVDSTQSLLATGALMLDLGKVPDAQTFTIELRSPNGFARPPRTLKIGPSVVPVRQGHAIADELHIGTGVPNANFALNEPGLCYAVGEEPIGLEVVDESGRTKWKSCPRLSECGPDENVYELDVQSGDVTFGNGVNGRSPAVGAQVYVSYAVSDAEQGNVARNRRWQVAGFSGAFGVNPDPMTGGAGPSALLDQRREARRRAREDHALVSAADIEAGALALPLLEVVRAWVVTPDGTTSRTGVVRLIAMRRRPDGVEPDDVPEAPRWLESIRRRLAPRMPLGTRLVVAAPRYVVFRISASLECERRRQPAAVASEVEAMLRSRLALADAGKGHAPRERGVPVTRRDVAAWMRATEGVVRITDLQLLDAKGQSTREISVPRHGLPKWQEAPDAIRVSRPGTGRAP